MYGTPALVAVIVALQEENLFVPEDSVTPIVEIGHYETRPTQTCRVNFKIQADDEFDGRSGEKACGNVMGETCVACGGHELRTVRY